MGRIKTFLVATVLLLSAMSAEAKILSFGVSAGTSNANYSIKGYSGAIENKMGFQAGVSCAVSVPFLSVTPEVWYSYNKFNVVDSSIFDGRTCSVKAQYIDMPILVGYSILGPLKLELGPRFSLYDSAKAKFYSGDPEKMDLGGLNSKVGYTAGLKLTVLGKLVVSARYNGQFGGRDTDLGITGSSFDVRKNSYTISIGCRL